MDWLGAEASSANTDANTDAKTTANKADATPEKLKANPWGATPSYMGTALELNPYELEVYLSELPSDVKELYKLRLAKEKEHRASEKGQQRQRERNEIEAILAAGKTQNIEALRRVGAISPDASRCHTKCQPMPTTDATPEAKAGSSGAGSSGAADSSEAHLWTKAPRAPVDPEEEPWWAQF